MFADPDLCYRHAKDISCTCDDDPKGYVRGFPTRRISDDLQHALNNTSVECIAGPALVETAVHERTRSASPPVWQMPDPPSLHKATVSACAAARGHESWQLHHVSAQVDA